MRRLTATGAAFAVAPRVLVATGTASPSVLVDGFEAGYVWDAKSTKDTTNPWTSAVR